MKRLNFKIIIGIILNTVYTLIVSSVNEYEVVSHILWPVIIVNLVGILLVLLGKCRIGAWVIIISSALFVPLGLFGVVGGKQILNELENEEINEE